MIYVCSEHHQAKLDRHKPWLSENYAKALKVKTLELVESVCPACILTAELSLHKLIKERVAA